MKEYMLSLSVLALHYSSTRNLVQVIYRIPIVTNRRHFKTLELWALYIITYYILYNIYLYNLYNLYIYILYSHVFF